MTEPRPTRQTDEVYEREQLAVRTGMHCLFDLVRTHDATGISGTGVVAQGVQFADGTVALRWLPVTGPNADREVRPTTALHDDIHSVIALHGHGGATKVRWKL